MWLSRRRRPLAPRGRPGSHPPAGARATSRRGRRAPALLLVPPLNARLPQQLAVLLLGHSLAALLDDRAHETTLARLFGTSWLALRRPDAGRQGTRQRSRLPLPVSPSIPPVPPSHQAGGSAPRRDAQLAATNESRKYWLTACSGTRKERPTRIASSSPE